MTLTQITEKGIKDGEIINADINASAAIAGTKISPDFGSQNIVTTGDLTINSATPIINLTDTNNDSDYQIKNGNGDFNIKDVTNNANRISINSSGTVTVAQHMDVGAGLDVTGDLTVDTNTLHVSSSNNRVGIGTTNPNETLDVYGTVQLTNFLKATGDLLLCADIDNDNTGSAMRFCVDGDQSAEKMRIDDTGRVGIGATSFNDTAEYLLVKNDSTAANVSIVASNNAHSSLNLGDEDDFNIQKIKSDHTDNSLQFFTDNQQRLQIQSNGDVYLNPTQGSTGVTSGAIRRFNAGLDYWGGTAGSANAIKYAAHGQSDDNMYGMGISNSLLELQSQVDIGFFCGSAGGGTGRRVERFRMKSDGNLEIADGNLIIGTNGHGIDFSATGDASGATSEKLDDYEEGTWTPQFVYWNGSAWVSVAFSNTPLTTNAGIYTKIGNIVHVAYYSENFLVTTGATGAAGIQGLPYQNSSTWTAFPISHADCFGNDAENGAVNASDYRLRFFTEDGITNATWSTSLGHIMLSATYRVA